MKFHAEMWIGLFLFAKIVLFRTWTTIWYWAPLLSNHNIWRRLNSIYFCFVCFSQALKSVVNKKYFWHVFPQSFLKEIYIFVFKCCSCYSFVALILEAVAPLVARGRQRTCHDCLVIQYWIDGEKHLYCLNEWTLFRVCVGNTHISDMSVSDGSTQTN